ncbi:MAG: hypothetical protein AB1791_20340, partial [Chloroflexota bacterium]
GAGEVDGLSPAPLHPRAPAARVYAARFVRAGRVRAVGNRPSDIVIEPAAIRAAVERELFTGRAMFIDHATRSSGSPEQASLRNLAGVTVEATWNEAEQAAEGAIRLYDNEAGRAIGSLLQQFLADAAAGRPVPDVGLSLVFWPTWKDEGGRMKDEGNRSSLILHPSSLKVITSIRHIESIDFVFEPAAGGRITKDEGGRMKDELQPSTFNLQPSTLQGDNMSEQTHSLSLVAAPEGDLPPEETRSFPKNLVSWATQALLATSGLPEPTRLRLAGSHFQSPAELQQAIEAARREVAALNQGQVIQLGGTPPRQPHITTGLTGFEQLHLAAEALLMGRRPPHNVRPLTGIRELYHLLSGDYEMTGVFQPERVQFANVNSSTMAALTANALNKVVTNLFQTYPQWWLPIATEVDFTSLQNARWTTLGGVGELPTVAEGASYTELTWDDQVEQDAFVKKGGYLGITLEAIDKDDTTRLQAAPRALAQAAWLTLAKAVSNIFTANSGVGPTLDTDSTALFHANHNNLGTTALSWSAWSATRTAMRKQTEVHSGERLGWLTAPKYLLVPPDLEATAIQVLASDQQPGTSNNDVNPFAEGAAREALIESARRRVIVVDLWTDTNNWAAVADPLLYPSIGLGYRYGRTPEVFSVASPTAGLMFTNDTMPIKVRYFFVTGPTDYRGLYKHNVA